MLTKTEKKELLFKFDSEVQEVFRRLCPCLNNVLLKEHMKPLEAVRRFIEDEL